MVGGNSIKQPFLVITYGCYAGIFYDSRKAENNEFNIYSNADYAKHYIIESDLKNKILLDSSEMSIKETFSSLSGHKLKIIGRKLYYKDLYSRNININNSEFVIID
jgi:hypothetical protein